MDISAKVTVNLSLMTNYQREIPSRNRKVFQLWAMRYRSFIQRRWNTFSRGGGDWPALKYRDGSILRDTNTLFTAMTPAVVAPSGSINEFFENGVVVGFGGPSMHPAGVSIEQVVMWHQSGAGNNPVREVIVEPDNQTRNQMLDDMKRAHPNANTV